MRWTAIELAAVELDRIRGVCPAALRFGHESARALPVHKGQDVKLLPFFTRIKQVIPTAAVFINVRMNETACSRPALSGRRHRKSTATERRGYN